MLDLIIQNRELIKLIYGLIVVLICVIIVFKTDKLFRISSYQGIRYFRNAFFFYGIAFAVRYFIGSRFFYETVGIGYPIVKSLFIKSIFEYFIIVAGFFLFYSLIWKKIETTKQPPGSSLFNKNLIIFYLMALIIVILDYTWNTYFLMFLSQIVLFSLASTISYVNYKEKGIQHKFLKFYFIAMLLTLTAWVLNAILSLEANIGVLIGIYIINFIIFLLFLFGVMKVTGRV